MMVVSSSTYVASTVYIKYPSELNINDCCSSIQEKCALKEVGADNGGGNAICPVGTTKFVGEDVGTVMNVRIGLPTRCIDVA